MGRDRCGQPSHRTLKLTISQEWIDGMNSFFACWYKFRKAKCNFNNFWVDVVKMVCGHLVHETLESAHWVYELIFLHADCTVINNFWLRPTLYSIYLTFKCQFIAVLLIKSLAVAERILWNRVCPSYLQISVLVFSWNWIISFLWIFSWCHKPLRSCA